MIFEKECPHSSVSMREKEWFLKGGGDVCLFSFPNWTPSLSDKAGAPHFFSYHQVKQYKHYLKSKASAVSLKNYGHSSISNVGHHRPAFSDKEHQVAYGGWIRALVTMATSYHSTLHLPSFIQSSALCTLGVLLWNGVLFILHRVRVSSSGKGIPVPEIDKHLGSITLILFSLALLIVSA